MGGNAPARKAQGFGQLHEIGQRHAIFRPRAEHIVRKIGGLGHADGQIALVVEQKDDNGQALADDGLQFLQVHHDAAVAGQTDEPPRLAAEGRANGGGQVIAHGGVA